RFVVAPSGDSEPRGHTRRHAPSFERRDLPAPPTGARSTEIALRPRQVFGLVDAGRVASSLLFAASRAMPSASWRRSFPHTAAGQRRLRPMGPPGFPFKRIALSRYSDTYLGGLDLTPACEAGQAAATQAPGIPPMSSP